MPRVLMEEEIDPIVGEVDGALSADEELAASERQRLQGLRGSQDFADGGTLGGARLYPLDGGQSKPRRGERNRGRPTTRRAWMWNGTESLLPLAWDPAGKIHDYARRYLEKRVCICCKSAGFRKARCPACAERNCELCHGGRDERNAEGKRIVIPCFYLRKQDVPYPRRFFGVIQCFLEECPRRGDRGFLSERDMRLHARSRHKMEYQAHQEILADSRTDEIEVLRRKVDNLLAAQARPDAPNGVRGRKVRQAKKTGDSTTKPAMA